MATKALQINELTVPCFDVANIYEVIVRSLLSAPSVFAGVAGVGQNEDSTLLLTWSVVWTVKKANSGILSTWLCRFPYAVLPSSNCTPDTINVLMTNFKNECEPYNKAEIRTCHAT